MGIFLINAGLRRFVSPNTLAYRSHALLLGNDPVECEIGFAGPEYQLEAERPIDFWAEPYTVRRQMRLSDFEGNNEGGRSDSCTRTIDGYERQPVTWSVAADGYHGVIIDTGHHTFASDIPWEPLGTDKPANYDTELFPTGPSYAEPYKYTDRHPYEAAVKGYPWATPYLAQHYFEGYDWTDLSSVPHHEAPQSGYSDCPTANELGLWNMVQPVTHVFVTIRLAGSDNDWEIMAASKFNKPVFLRIGGKLVCRYIGRFG